MNSIRSSSLHPENWRNRPRRVSKKSISPTEERAEQLGGLLEALVADLGLEHKLGEYRARQVWEEAVGPTLAAQSRPLKVRNGRMEVAVPSAVWRTQLSFMQKDIVDRINQLAGQKIIRELILRNQR